MSETENPESTGAAAHETVDHPPLAGSPWAGLYEILSQLPDSGGGGAWKAKLRDSDELLLVRAGRSTDAGRRKAWESMLGLSHPGLLRCIDRRMAGQRWYEVYSFPKGQTLAEWRERLGSPGEEQLTALVQAITPALAALHDAGIGHFNLRQDTVFVTEQDGALQVQLGGLELATTVTQKDLVNIPVDSFTAPPEAAGLYKHSPGEDLLTWDWWSLGRLLQELILGQPVLGAVLNRDVSRVTPEIREKAEQLLLERLPGNFRAGALEAMPPLSDRLQLLLRGLLAGSRDARWRASEMRLWCEGGTPLEHYSLPNKEHCFRYEGQAHTVSEAAGILRTEQHWDAAIEQLFDPEKPGTLSHFIHQHSAAVLQQQIDLVAHLKADDWIMSFPKLARDEVLTALALQQLAGGGRLLWRGRHMDAATVMDLLRKEDGQGSWLGCVRLFSSPPVLGILDKTDTETERILTDIGRYASKATQAAQKGKWLARNDVMGELRIWELSADPAFLRQVLSDLRSRYAASSVPEIDALFRMEHPVDEVRMLLGYLAARPERYGFITHEDWARRRYQELYDEGMDIAETLFWKRLRGSLGSGPWWFGRIWWMVAGWGGFALAFAILKPGPLWLVVGLLPALFAAAVRWAMLGSLNPIISAHFPRTSSWRFLDGPGRCAREIESRRNVLRSQKELWVLLKLHNADIARLTIIQPPPPPIMLPPRFVGLRLTAYASWLLLAGLLALCIHEAEVHPPSLEAIRLAWSFGGKVTAADAEKAERAQKIDWPYKAPVEARAISIVSQHPAGEEEAGEALRRGLALLAKFKQNTISDPILVPVSSEKGFAFAVYDGRKRGLASKNIIVLNYQPMPRNWLLIDGRKVFVYVE